MVTDDQIQNAARAIAEALDRPLTKDKPIDRNTKIFLGEYEINPYEVAEAALSAALAANKGNRVTLFKTIVADPPPAIGTWRQQRGTRRMSEAGLRTPQTPAYRKMLGARRPAY